MIRAACRVLTEISGDPCSSRESFEVQVGRACCAGRSTGWSAAGEDGVRVTDLKTGAGPSVAEAPTNAQLGAYQLAVESGAFPGSARRAQRRRPARVRGRGRACRPATQEALGPEAEGQLGAALVDRGRRDDGRREVPGVENSLCDTAACGAPAPSARGRQVVA